MTDEYPGDEPDARRLRRLAREAEALRIVKQIRSKSLCPINPNWERPTPEQIEADRIARLDDDPEHSVYFLYCANHVKIGYTAVDYFINRIRDLRTGTPIPTVHLFAMSGGKRTEYLLHKKFAQYRVVGEWFRFSAEIRGFIFEHGNEHDAEAIHEAEVGYRKWLANEALNFGLIKKSLAQNEPEYESDHFA